MTEILFDTQKLVEQLEDSGVPTVQARAHVAVLLEVIAAMETAIIERCATKQDISELRDEIRAMKASLESRFAHVDARFAEADARMAKQEARLIRWMVSLGFFQSALIGALLLKLIP